MGVIQNYTSMSLEKQATYELQWGNRRHSQKTDTKCTVYVLHPELGGGVDFTETGPGTL